MRKNYGFTLIEMLIVMAIVALLLTLSVPRYFSSLEKTKVAVLKDNLSVVRKTIDQFYSDKGRYPNSMDELVDSKYLRSLPIDPITESDRTWIITNPQTGVAGGVYDIRSGAPGSDQNGKPYGDL